MNTEGPTPATQIADLRRTLDSVFAEREKARAALRGLLPLVGHNELSHSTDAESSLCSRCAAVREAKAALAPTGDRAEPGTGKETTK